MPQDGTTRNGGEGGGAAARSNLATLLWTLLVLGLAVAAWRLSSVLLLGFAGVLLAVLFRNLASLVARYTGVPIWVGLTVAIGAVAGLIALLTVTIGPQLAGQFVLLAGQAPETLETVERELRTTTSWGSWFFERLEQEQPSERWNILGTVTGTVSTLLSLGTNLVILLSVAVFLAVDPPLYRRGLLHLVPPRRRERGGEVLDALAFSLWRWLLGQGLSMAFVGLLILVGLWAIGVPLAFALATIAALTNFVPFVGPVLGAVPALLVAVPEGMHAVALTGALFLVVQQFDGNVFTPMIQKQATSLPPVLIILGVTAAGILFGLAGVFLATPLLLVIVVLVRMLYVEDVLGDEEALGPEEAAVEGEVETPAAEFSEGVDPTPSEESDSGGSDSGGSEAGGSDSSGTGTPDARRAG
jgi:predicted PurR-regulated permease PerM